MGRKCCVPDCTSNYDAAIKNGVPAASTFKFPEDPSLLDRWLTAIRRPGWSPSKSSSICINHFETDSVERYDKPAKLKPNAVPSLFGELVLPTVGSVPAKRGRPKKREELQTDALQLENLKVTHNDQNMDLQTPLEENCIGDFEQFKSEVGNRLKNKAWAWLCKPNVVHLLSVVDEDDCYAVKIDTSLKVFSDFRMRLFFHEIEQTDELLQRILGVANKLSSWSQLDSIITSCDAATRRDLVIADQLLLHHVSTEPTLDGEDYETMFLEEHLDESEFCDTDMKQHNESMGETILELNIQAQSPEEDQNHTEIGDIQFEKSETSFEGINYPSVVPAGESTEQPHAKRKSISEIIRELQSVKNKCFICNTEHGTVEELELHMPTHLPMLPYRCTGCTRERVTVNTLASLNKHHLMHLKPLQCRFCDKRFTTYSSRKLHEDYKHAKGPTTVTCGVCQREFPSQRSYLYHRKVHDDPDALRCTICHRTLSSAYEVKLHMRTHTGERPNKCPFCAVSFNRKSNLTQHVRRCHNMERPHACDVCGERFRSTVGLKRHMVSHGGAEPTRQRKVSRSVKVFHCQECDRNFSTPIQYHSHKRQHVKRYQCSYCGIRIAQLRDFEDHENTHTGSRPYECQTCGKAFKTASTYYSHRLVHSAEKKHFCTICNKGFLRMRHVQVHMRTHTGEKPFRCETCGRKYADKQTFTRHKLTHRPTVGDMLRAKEDVAQAANLHDKLRHLEGVTIHDNAFGMTPEQELQSELIFSTGVFTSDGMESDVLNSESSVVFDGISQGSYGADLPTFISTTDDPESTMLMSADMQNVIIVET